MRKHFTEFLREFRISLIASVVVASAFWFCIDDTLFEDPLSTAVYDAGGELIGARIASDGQWRFPEPDSIPDKFREAIVCFEDQYFYLHPGINPLSLSRALLQNIRSGEIVSGGSTLTMQVIRISRKGKKRTIYQKMIESVLSLRHELTASKEKILKEYAANAPFGGNVVGLEAAAWRYFGASPENLTYSESALLAVLPNAPSLIHPGKNRMELKEKRDRLLKRMREKNLIDSLTCNLACDEPLPEEPKALPNIAPHLTDRFLVEQQEKRIGTTISASIQRRTNEIVSRHQVVLSENQVHNLACMVMDVETGNVLAYVGNTGAYDESGHGNNVDVIMAPRSTGSIIKPFLFAGMLDRAEILPTTLVPDVPVRYFGYAPKNYNRGYEGAVPAYMALERSLNIPAVIMLRQYGVEPFLFLLKNLGFTTFTYPAGHYGLSLILGGAEATLWELSGAYSSMARILNHYNSTDGNYFISDIHNPVLLKNMTVTNPDADPVEHGVLSAGAIYETFQSLLKVNRPDDQSLWYLLNSSRPIAWKTGTSYGFRDAWAIGVTPEYLVGVWAGNADGEGRTGLTGLLAAAPVLFEVFSSLPETSWFEEPLDDMTTVEICSKSGYLAGPHCTETEIIHTNMAGQNTTVCPYHRIVHLSPDEKYRVSNDCMPVSEMVHESWFVLPPLIEWYYRKKDPLYRELPPVKPGCNSEEIEEMELIYPEWGNILTIPVELDSKKGRVIMEVAHRDPESKIFWHIDDHYLGSTTGVHQMPAFLEPGEHILRVVDGAGNEKSVRFSVIGKK